MKNSLMIVDQEPFAPLWALSPELDELFMSLFLSDTGFYEYPPGSGHTLFSYELSDNQYRLLVVDLPDGGLSFQWRRTGEVFLALDKEEAEALFRRWHEVRYSGAVRILIRAKDNKIFIDGHKRRKGGKIRGMASMTLNLKKPIYNVGCNRSVKTLFKFVQALPQQHDGKVLKFIQDKDCRELTIAGFELKKRVGKIIINGMDGDEPLKEARLMPGELLKIIPEFRDAIATKPEEIGIARDNRGLIVVMDKTAKDLLFGK